MTAQKPKVAIACQGGGSQTAFTAGVLKGLFEEGVHEDFNVVSLSGTSGGSICAALAWYALEKKDREPHEPVRIPRTYPGAEDRDYYIPFIEMSAGSQAKLDYESKLDRSPENIGTLIADGERQARMFLKERA